MCLQIRSDLAGKRHLAKALEDKVPLELHGQAKVETIWLFGLDICAISQKHVRQVFSWIKALAKLAPLNSGLAGFASRAGWAHGPGPGTGLSPGGFLAASCQKQGKGRLPCTDNPS